MATQQRINKLAEELFANKEWRDDQNEAVGRQLTCKQMFEEAKKQAQHLLEEAEKN